MEQARVRDAEALPSVPAPRVPVRTPLAPGGPPSVPGPPAPSAVPAARAPSPARDLGGPRPAPGVPGTAPAAPPPGPAPRTVRRHSVRGQVLEALRSALADGRLQPGHVYSAPALGARFGVSATPVREAMQQLASEGAVEVVPNRGFRVCVRSAAELAEVAEVRALIEVPVVLRLAATVPAGRWEELRPLAEATAAAAAAGDRAAYAEADRAFHRALLSLAGNRRLLALAEELHRSSRWPPPAPGAAAADRAVLAADAAEHTALLEALIARDLDAVRSLVRGHISGSDA
ncbi:GntR family transcriptional regulator [Streptomyces sp. C10-9-1]|uniref:GntR family transcriptional regulator n=1 Tax=Streptomyces sp. C10-9-1 TaxID=1859285 RepID=UPI0021115195|nr:GntR family transcriptional regulator [Streptomyces sp. C10-9-1]MCQ6551835.1 GntR family transcriptional regulator [Streptomyces sp. C10-9-1]